MVRSIINKQTLIFCIFFFISGCGTQLTCSGEVGAPPEREFWCSPFSKIGKIFFVQKNYKDNKNTNINESVNTSICEDTIGDKECNEKE